MQDSGFCTYRSVGTGNRLGGGERAFRRVGFIAAVIVAKGGDFWGRACMRGCRAVAVKGLPPGSVWAAGLLQLRAFPGGCLGCRVVAVKGLPPGGVWGFFGSHLHERLVAAGSGSGSEADLHIGWQRLGSR